MHGHAWVTGHLHSQDSCPQNILHSTQPSTPTIPSDRSPPLSCPLAILPLPTTQQGMHLETPDQSRSPMNRLVKEFLRLLPLTTSRARMHMS